MRDRFNDCEVKIRDSILAEIKECQVFSAYEKEKGIITIEEHCDQVFAVELTYPEVGRLISELLELIEGKRCKRCEHFSSIKQDPPPVCIIKEIPGGHEVVSPDQQACDDYVKYIPPKG